MKTDKELLEMAIEILDGFADDESAYEATSYDMKFSEDDFDSMMNMLRSVAGTLS